MTKIKFKNQVQVQVQVQSKTLRQAQFNQQKTKVDPIDLFFYCRKSSKRNQQRKIDLLFVL